MICLNVFHNLFATLLTTLFCIFAAHSSVCGAGDEPYFSKSPENVDVIQGESVTLPCEVTPGTGMTYYWELNGKCRG